MIKSLKDYLKQWLILLYLIPSTISVIQTYFSEGIKNSCLSFINSLSKSQEIFIVILISMIVGIKITFKKNKNIRELENDIEILLQQNSATVNTYVNNIYYGDINLRQYINSNVIIGDESKIVNN